ncbi:hypothetical protein KFE25_010976 [Diacronema lutheri]|uniref:Protein kinase domain-containing protein n=1 Tax=Diacronema lutheri TaxID=2081491 RepID=A0A8J5XAS3_DIALT|nr:hypothetical protein KFE25_010976 [Diacronema lutheri]
MPVVRCSLEERYDVLDVISEGRHTRIVEVARRTRRGPIRSPPGARLAAKEIDLDVMGSTAADREEAREAVLLEASLLARAKHPTIVRALEVLVCHRAVVLVMELAERGDLLELLVATGPLDEPSAAHVVRQLASALARLHDLDIVHRDVKPDNILVTSAVVPPASAPRAPPSMRLGVQLSSFGFATHADRLDGVGGLAGTLDYAAPEVLSWHPAVSGTPRAAVAAGFARTRYGPAVDVWSLGVVTHALLTGTVPFAARTEAGLVAAVRAGWAGGGVRGASADASDFVRCCLAILPADRLTAHEALRHPWLRQPAARSAPASPSTSARARAREAVGEVGSGARGLPVRAEPRERQQRRRARAFAEVVREPRRRAAATPPSRFLAGERRRASARPRGSRSSSPHSEPLPQRAVLLRADSPTMAQAAITWVPHERAGGGARSFATSYAQTSARALEGGSRGAMAPASLVDPAATQAARAEPDPDPDPPPPMRPFAQLISEARELREKCDAELLRAQPPGRAALARAWLGSRTAPPADIDTLRARPGARVVRLPPEQYRELVAMCDSVGQCMALDKPPSVDAIDTAAFTIGLRFNLLIAQLTRSALAEAERTAVEQPRPRLQ